MELTSLNPRSGLGARLEPVASVMKLSPITDSVPTAIQAFGLQGSDASPLPGVGRRAFRVGAFVLKFVGKETHEPTVAWLAELFSRLPSKDFRVPRLIQGRCGNWIWDGWIAMEWLPGSSRQGEWATKVAASRALHAAIGDAVLPASFEPNNGVWARADRAAWGEERIAIHPELQPLIEPLLERRVAVTAMPQLIHGDLSRANFLLHAGRPPAIIDFAPYLRPPGLALAIMAVDEAAWYGADLQVFDQVSAIEHWDQLLLRAAVMRLVGLQELAKLHPGWNWLGEVAGLRPVVRAIAGRLDT